MAPIWTLDQTMTLIAPFVVGGLLMACSPTVAVEAPKAPITINLNITLDAEVRVKLEEQAEKDIEANPNLF